MSLLIWQLTRTGVFDVPSFCNLLFIFDKSLFIIHYWKRLLFLSLGRAFGVLRYLKGWSFFLWTAARFGILTIDNLVKKKWPLVNWFCLCCFFFFFYKYCLCRDEETVDHLLLHCKFAHALWSKSFLFLGFSG